MAIADYADDPYRQFIFYRTYSRWRDDLNRRESWEETVQRFISHMKQELGDRLTEKEYQEVSDGITSHDVMPSMRLFWSSGPAVTRTDVCAYNCAYVAPTRIRDFGDILYILTCGAGLGFSCEEHVVDQLPEIKKQTNIGETPTYIIPDDKEGWSQALIDGMSIWYNGGDVEFDYSEIRPKGARLKTMGGRASGPEPLKNLLNFTREKIIARQGKKLRPIDVHDIICQIGEIVVSGGVRRSAEISLSDLDNENMRDAKKGRFWEEEPQRTMANNSAVYNKKPTRDEFDREWKALRESGSGERGIFNRGGLLEQMPERRAENIDGKTLSYMGTNPCGEITLRSRQFCNLTSVTARKGDTKEDLKDKVRLATILGTYQSSLTDFPFLQDEWQENCEDEALLGVSIAGQFDCETVRDPEVLQELKAVAVKTNKEYADRIGVNQSASVTAVKPEGNSSQLRNCSSGMHPRYSDYYIKRVRISANDPLFHLMRDEGVPYHPETGQTEEDATTFVLEFPIKSPDGAITREDMTAIDQLEYWKMVKENYTEHNPSQTIYIADDEWDKVADWLWDNWEIVGGLSFLPKDDSVYELAPYEPITKEEYEELKQEIPDVDYSRISEYEYDDFTTGANILACSGGVCEIDEEELAEAAA